MNEQTPPDFEVADRRSGSSENTVKKTERSSASTQESEPEMQKKPSNATHSETDHPGQPDPVLLLSLAAVHMDVFAFAQSLLGVFDAYAWQAMGLIAHPITQETRRDLPAAQMAIDCVQFLISKIESRLSEPDRRELSRRLNDLRMNYLTKQQET